MRLLRIAVALFALPCGCGSSSNAAPANDGGTQDTATSDAPTVDGGGMDGAADAASDVAADAPAACPTVTTGGGPVLGQLSGATCSYLGIPFAAPPVGALRWKPPQPPTPWTTPRPSMAGSGCPQVSSYFGMASTDEDCLFVDVWTPNGKTGPLPVMVFVHGGGFTYGSGTFPLYDGTTLAAATGAIVVTLNYRLGAFGFLSNAALRAEDPAHPSAGNYGIEDQIAAFQWVKANAAAFGGAASNVTIFGESAGGTSMFVHLASPKSQGLFEKVIVESGWESQGQGVLSTAAADQNGATLATALGCTDPMQLLTCLRGKAVSDVLTASTPILWIPVVDSFILPDTLAKLFAAGTFNKVPTLLGTNKNEGTLFTYMSPPTDPATYQALAEAEYPGHGAAIVAQYPISAYGGSYMTAASEALGDGSFVCPTRRVARACVAAGVPTYRYDFTHAIPFVITGLGAFHGSELPFVFGNPLLGVMLQPNEKPLSQAFMSYWGNMAANGDPNGGGQPAWPKYDATTETDLVLDLTISTETQLKKSVCDFWDGLGP